MSVINPANGGRIDYPIDCGPTDRERVQEKIKDYPNVEFTRENTVGDPWGAIEPTKLGKETKSWGVLKSILKHIWSVYMWGCALGVSAFIIYAYIQWMIGE